MPSEDRDVRSKKNSNTAPSANQLADWALQGLLTGFGCNQDRVQHLKNRADEPPDAVCKTCADILEASREIGQALWSDERPNNQFALFNLVHARALIRALSQSSNASNNAGDDLRQSLDGRSGSDLPLNRVTSAMAKFRSEIAVYAAYSTETDIDVSESISSTLTKYFTRENFRMSKRENYGIVLFFLIGLAHREAFDFEDDKVLKASPAIKNLFLEAQAGLADDEPSPSLVCERVVEALSRSRIALLSHKFLGGLLEIGATDVRHLWRPLFAESPVNHVRLSHQASIERHYVCYRLTSSEQDLEALKSFLVFQSPGYVKTTAQTRREHFAMKAYTQYDSDLMRSVGAVVELGEQIVGFASRGKQADEEEPGLLHPSQFRGATMLAFNKIWFTAQKGVLLGMLMTTNQVGRNVSCPILCLRTEATHSDDVELGIVGKDSLADDISQFSCMQEGRSPDKTAFNDFIWDLLLSRPAENVEYDSESKFGAPPIVAPDVRPRGLLRKLAGFGFSMQDYNAI